MKDAWLVVRKEKHIDDAYWTCMEREDAIKIASDVSEWWLQRYEPDEKDEVDTELYGGQVFHVSLEDAFSVEVIPHKVREPGEANTGGGA